MTATSMEAEPAGQAGSRPPRIRAALAGMAVAAMVALSACGSSSDSDADSDPVVRSTTIPADLPGLTTYADLARNHVPGTVDYSPDPPVGGNHAPVWQNCGFYPAPIVTEQGVHSMEHGAVWITYDPALPADQVDVLRKLAAGTKYVLVSPFPGLPSPVVASAWGVQLSLPSAGDPRLARFVDRFEQGPQTPEPGAPCTGAVGDPE